jgi:hypothetical protein
MSDFFRLLLRFLGVIVIALSAMCLNYDLTKTLDAGLRVTKVGDLWYPVHPTSLQLLQPAIERHVSQWLWDPVVLSVLTAPAWLVFGVIGAVLMLIGRKKKPLIGYARE